MITRSVPVVMLFPIRRDELGKKIRICRYCGAALPPRRMSWCSDACRDEAFIRCRPGWARHKVFERDKGICAECGTDCGLIKRIGWRFKRIVGRQTWGTLWKEWSVILLQMGFHPGAALWEADHIKPVSEGGGFCGLDNLRTLCRPCHVKASARLARRKAIERRRFTGTLFEEGS